MVTIHAWWIPTVLTVMIWSLAVFVPGVKSQGDYDFAPALYGLVRFAVSVIATLVVWLGYFVWRSW